ncbi:MULTISPECIES: DNA adenine methylase [Neisseria]|uniref:DNA adenine methylase n=1 Tax=Neisseria TaxID=482 RepID=UPI0035A13AC0
MAKASVSPLRYPGGKSSLLDLLSGIIRNNELRYYGYAEPYAGGCGLALALMYGGYVSDIHINDIDPGVWSFWYSILEHTQDIIKLIETTKINLDEWERQRNIYIEANKLDPIALGFATFFLNRTNRSGIIKGAGVIGGKSQIGNYKMDCRFNRQELIARIKRVSKYKERIFLTNMDAIEFIKNTNSLVQKIFFFIDPPYYNKGSSLYTNFYKPKDHADVAQAILILDKPWIITYDNVEEISKLYQNCRQYPFNINYSLQTKRKGSELLITSDDIYLGNELTRYQSV